MEIRKAIFLDKDGTLIPNIPFNVDPDQITLSENSALGLQNLSAAGYQLVIVSNQSGIAMDLFKASALQAVEDKIRSLLRQQDVDLAGFYVCPHHPKAKLATYREVCSCRKPGSGMLLKAAKDMDISLKDSWMIGDILHDVEAGNSAGCKTILINNGNETEWLMDDKRTPDCMKPHINAAAAYILEMDSLKSVAKHESLETL